MRFVIFLATVLMPFGMAPPGTRACGDKFLTAACGLTTDQGESPGGAAMVVLYRPPDDDAESAVRDPELEKNLRDAGWQVEISESIDSLRAALVHGAEAVLVDLSNLEEVRSDVAPLAADTVFVPVMKHPSRAAYREAAKQHAYLMRTPSGRGHVQSVLTKVLQRGA